MGPSDRGILDLGVTHNAGGVDQAGDPQSAHHIVGHRQRTLLHPSYPGGGILGADRSGRHLAENFLHRL